MVFPADWKTDETFNTLSMIKAKYSSIKMDGINIEPEFLQVTQGFCQNIETLVLKNVVFDTINMFYDFFELECFKNIKILFIENCGIDKIAEKLEDSMKKGPQVLLKLRRLLLISTNGNEKFLNAFLSFITNNHEIEKIFLEIDHVSEKIGNRLKIIFESQRTVLKSLALTVRLQVELISPIFKGIQNLELESFSFKMTDYDDLSPTSNEINETFFELARTLTANKTSLKNLELILIPFITLKIFKVVVNDLKIERFLVHTKKTHIDTSGLFENPFLKTLIIKRSLTVDLIGIYPNIEYLAINDKEDWNCDYFGEFYQILKNVKTLHLYQMPNQQVPDIELPTLKTLWIDYHKYQNVYKEFLRENQTIETLYLKSQNRVLNERIIKMVAKQLKNLKKLIIEQDGFVIDSQLLQILSDHCPNLRSIETVYKQNELPKHDKILVVQSKKFINENNLIEKDTIAWKSQPEFIKELSFNDKEEGDLDSKLNIYPFDNSDSDDIYDCYDYVGSPISNDSDTSEFRANFAMVLEYLNDSD